MTLDLKDAANDYNPQQYVGTGVVEQGFVSVLSMVNFLLHVVKRLSLPYPQNILKRLSTNYVTIKK